MSQSKRSKFVFNDNLIGIYRKLASKEHKPTNQENNKKQGVREMRDKAYNICRNFLSGEWKKISSSDMVFKTLSGGLSNHLFYCSLPSTHTPLKGGEPSQVLLRMYGQLHDDSEIKVTDSVITMLLSERKLGPKLYGIFPGGRLEEYIPARAMTCQELKNPTYAAIIARKLANVHSLDVPINKEPTWLFDTMNRWLDYIRTKIPYDDFQSKIVIKEMLSYDFESELSWLKDFLSKVKSPSVFSHNDLQEGNILLPESSSNSKKRSLINNNPDNDGSICDDRIVFIDFEYCSYNFRGFDIGNHFCERMFDYSNPNPPYYYAYMDAYPNDSEKRSFIKEYLKQNKKLQKNPAFDKINTEDHLIREADSFALASHLLWTLWAITYAYTSKIHFGYWEYAKTRLTAYHNHKDQLLSRLSSVKVVKCQERV